MNIATIYQRLTSRLFNDLFRLRRQASLAAGRRARFRPRLEALEDRLVPSLSVNLDQWADGPAPDADGTGGNQEVFVNGNLNPSKAHYNEGDSIPYRAVIDDLTNGVEYGLVIQWDTVDSGAYAIDYLTGYNFSFDGSRHPGEPDVTPTFGVNGLSSGAISPFAIPLDPQLLDGFGIGTQFGVTDGLGSGLPSGQQYITVFGAVSIDPLHQTSAITYNADHTKASITVFFTYTGSNANNADSVVVAWGGHIASSIDWHDDPGETVQTASDISGSPYHTRVTSILVNGVPKSIGNQDRSLSASAVSGPSVTEALLLADEDDVVGAGGNAGGSGDDAPSGLTGTLSVINVSSINFADLHLDPVVDTSSVAVKSGGVALTYFWDGASSTLYGSTNTTSLAQAQATAVFTMQVAASSPFTYTFTLLDQVDHPSQDGTGNDNTENNVLIDLTYTAVGAGTTPGVVHVSIDDDSPSIVVADTVPPDALTVDETILADNASANFADNFSSTPTYGADGAGTVSSAYALSVKTSGGDSGLDDVATGNSVFLFLNASGVVEGREGTDATDAATGDIVFTVSVGAASGTVTLDQLRAIVHPNAANPDDSKTLSAADLIVLTRTDTITDKDGDQNTGSDFLNIGQALNFEDDGPSIVVADTVPPDALTVDETILADNASANFADNFSSTPTYGADGAGTVSSAYALSVKTSGGDSGLDDVATGNSVFLFLNASGVVEGREGTDATDAATGDIVFTVSVGAASGTVTLDQLRAIVHPNTANPDDSKTLSAADLIVLTRTDTITDKDGDQNTGSDFLNIGQALNFEDDGPSIVVADTVPPDALTVDETILADNASANFADNFSSTPTYGADGAGTVSSAYALSVKTSGGDSGLDDVATGNSVFLFLNASGVVEGREGTDATDAATGDIVFTVSVGAASGTVTLDQLRAIVHPNTANPDDSKTLSAADLIVLTRTDTITDKDGDQNTGSDFLNIGQALNFEDDGPSIVVADTVPPDALTVDETILADNASANFADNFSSTPTYGADGAGTVSSAYALSVKTSGGDSGLDDVATGNSVFLFLNASGVVEGREGTDATDAATGDIVFTVSVGAASGTVTLDQLRAIVHPNTANPDDSKTLSAADLIVLTRTDTITDKDGDQNTGSDFLNIGQALNFEDDGPSIVVADTVPPDALTVDETILADNASANFADNFSSTPTYGADGAGTVSSAYALSVKTSGGDSGLDDVATGNSVFLFLNASGVVEGREGTDATDAATGDIVFTVSVGAASGTVTLDQLRAIVHPNTANPDDSKTLSAADLIVLTRTDTITDKDGDQNTGSDFLNIGQALNFEDDGPSIVVADTVPPDALTVDETILADNASANFADNFSSTPTYGADGAGTVSSAYALSVKTSGGDSGLDDVATGNSVFLFLNASGVVEGREGTDATDAATGDIVFTVSVGAASGTVTLDQLRAIVHPNTANPDDSKTLSAADLIVLTRTDTITDKDGDQNTGSDFLNIGQALNFEDDGPSILARTDLIYSNASNPSPGGTGTFDYDIGADARLSFSVSNSDFSAITLTGTVGNAAITSPTVTWSSESSTSASFGVSFSYQPDPNSPATSTATGTLSFDKVNGTYSLALTAPLSGFNTVSTGQALGFTGYTVGTATVDQTQPDVSVAKLSDNFFVQFTGYSEPGGGTGANNLQAVAQEGALGTPTEYVNGDLFKQAATWVSVSNAANGTAGDTIQQGEVLDLDFFFADPFGFTTATPTTQASGMFLKFDGIGSEDLVLVLKLIDPDDGTRTTKAIIIDNADIIKFGDTIPAPYSIVLDNNDGAVIIESNDFNTGTQNYLIEGAQLLVSTEGVTGTAINLNSSTGGGGGSTTFQEFSGTPGTANSEAATTDNDVIKISDIGFVTVNSGQLDASLHFSLSIKDADGDAIATQVLDVGIVGGTTFTGGADDEAIQGSAGNDTLNGGAGNDVLTGGLGKDTLDGGDGNDVYDFNFVAESPAGANKDLISGFVTGADKIDLSGIDAISGNANANDAFSYLGGAVFTNAAGQLSFDAATSTLQADIDGNGSADFEVQLTGIVTPPPLGDIIV